MFVGLSNYIQITVLKYYVRTIKEYRVPKAIRANKGVETVLVRAVDDTADTR